MKPWEAYLLPVDAQPRYLSIKVGKIASLQQGVIAESDARNDVASAKSDLLHLRKVLVDNTVENEFPNRVYWNERFRPNFCGIEDIEVKVMFVFFFNDLDSQSPLWETTRLDGLLKIFTVEI